MADTTKTRADSYTVAYGIEFGKMACLDMTDMKIKTACAIATPTVTAKYFEFEVAMPAGSWAYLDTDGKYKMASAPQAAGSYMLATAVAA
jgi:hypothetical protein